MRNVLFMLILCLGIWGIVCNKLGGSEIEKNLRSAKLFSRSALETPRFLKKAYSNDFISIVEFIDTIPLTFIKLNSIEIYDPKTNGLLGTLFGEEFKVLEEKELPNQSSPKKRIKVFTVALTLDKNLIDANVNFRPIFLFWRRDGGGNRVIQEFVEGEIKLNPLKGRHKVLISSNVEKSNVIIVPLYYFEDNKMYYYNLIEQMNQNRFNTNNIKYVVGGKTELPIIFEKRTNYVVLCGSDGYRSTHQHYNMMSAVLPETLPFSLVKK